MRSSSPLVASLALIVVAHGSAAPVAGREPASLVIAADRIGPLQIDPATSYRGVVRAFARPASVRFDADGCRLRFGKIGLFVNLMTLDDRRAGTPATCRFFLAAAVTGRRWRTPNGLRVGAPLRSLRRLFLRAFDSGKIPGRHFGIPVASTRWELTQGSPAIHAAHPILVAYVREGRVAALGVDVVGH
jgi:hypothetical protein